MPEPSAGRYARRIERRWSELLGRGVVLSPRDFQRIARWHASGVPLEVVDEAMAAVTERPSRRPPRLADLARLVEEAWSAILAGRRAGATAEPAPAPSPLERWRRLAAAEARTSGLGLLLRELLARGERGEPSAVLDEELDRRLPQAVPGELWAAVGEAVERELSPYRGRMSPERLRRTSDRARIERLRKRLGLPRLASGPTGQ